MNKFNINLPNLEEPSYAKKWKQSDIDRISNIKFIANLQSSYESEIQKSTIDVEKVTILTYSIINMHKYIMNIEEQSVLFDKKRIEKAYQESLKNTYSDFPISCFNLSNDRQINTLDRILNDIERLNKYRDDYLFNMIREIEHNDWFKIKYYYLTVAKIVYQIYHCETILRKLYTSL
jgi:hypothetical protein